MAMIYPIFVVVMLTFAVGICMGFARVASVKQGEVDPRFYKLHRGAQAPDRVAKLERNFANLFEVPILFYVLGLAMMALNIDDPTLLMMAWGFVGLRILHTLIHTTYNYLVHRFIAFLLSTFLLIAMWVRLILLVNA